MRIVLAFSFVVAVLAVSVSYTRPQYIHTAYSAVEDTIYAQLFERDVHVTGLRLLREQRVHELLPVHYSNVWWRLNPSTITRTLSDNPLIQSVSVAPCSFISLRCFKVSVEEREVGVIAVLEDGVWVLGKDGGNMVPVAPLPDADRVSALRKKLTLPLVYGLSGDAASPLMVRSRALYVMRSLAIIEESLNVSTSEVRLRGNGELAVRFVEYPFEVVFDSSFDKPERLQLEVARLADLLAEIAGKERAIARIDMAYERSAVVTLTERAEIAQKEQDRLRKKVVDPESSKKNTLSFKSLSNFHTFLL